MTTKCLVFILWSQLFFGIVLRNFIKCDCPFPKKEILNSEYLHVDSTDAIDSDAKEEYILFFRCSEGYELIGVRAIQCLEGKWSGKVPLCKAMQCSAPPKVSNGTYTFTANHKTKIPVGTQAIYSCDPGFELSDPSVSRLTCILKEDGDETLWAGDIPSCQAKQCGSPPRISNRRYTLTTNDKNKITIGTQAIYACNPGYEFSDPSVSRLTCILSEDGNETLWAGDIFGCQAMKCSAPSSISNGTYTFTANDKTEITVGTQAIYSCNPGFELSDPSVSRLTCILNEDGNETLWAGDIPSCQEMKPCPRPGFSKDGTRKGRCFLPGCIVSYSCKKGFEIVGEKDIKCLLSRRWSSPRPLCRPLGDHCELPPEIPNGVVERPSGDYALPGEEMEIVCKPGYKFNGPNQYPYCNESALWEDEFGECEEIFCDRPEPPANGYIPELEESDFKDTFPNNFVLTYDCNEGYRLKGEEPWRVCTKDGWSGADPFCEEIFCPDPGVPQEGSRLGDSFKVGAKVSFKCFTGFELLGSFERYCTPNGKWTGELARCNAPTNYCPNPGIPINGIRTGESYFKWNKLEFRCRDGFIQAGSKVRTCMSNRTWSGTETKCLGPHDFDSSEEIVKNLKIPSNGRLMMYFAFDVSGSMQKNFENSIEFAKDIVKKIGVSEDGTGVGALTFSTWADTAFFPMENKNTQDVLRLLDEIEYTGGGTSLTSALDLMINNVKLVDLIIPGNKKTVLFLITDGKANMLGSPEYQAKILKENLNVEIFCIGMTGGEQVEALYRIASTSTHGNEERPNVFILKNYKKLNWRIQDLTSGTTAGSQHGFMKHLAGA